MSKNVIVISITLFQTGDGESSMISIYNQLVKFARAKKYRWVNQLTTNAELMAPGLGTLDNGEPKEKRKPSIPAAS